jgi:hypothetical protein
MRYWRGAAVNSGSGFGVNEQLRRGTFSASTSTNPEHPDTRFTAIPPNTRRIKAMADKLAKEKDVEKIRKRMKAQIAKAKKAPKVEKSKAAAIGNKLKEEKAKLAGAFKALASAPDA